MSCHKLAALALLGVLLSAPAFAQDLRLPQQSGELGEGIELSKSIRLRPFGRWAVFYTNNPEQEPNRLRDDDVVSTINVGLGILFGDLEEGSAYFQAQYALTYRSFIENGGLDTFEHRFSFDGVYEVGKWRFSGSGTGALAQTNTDPQFAGIVRNFTGSGTVEIDYSPTELLTLRVDGSAVGINNFPDEFEPFNNITPRVGAFVVVTPNVEGLELEAGGNYRQIYYVSSDAVNPDLDLYSAQAGIRLSNDLVALRARGGYEFSDVRRRRALPRSVPPPEGPLISASISVTPTQTLTFDAFSSYQARYTANSFFQDNTAFGGGVNFTVPGLRGLTTFASGTYEIQDPFSAPGLYTQTYRAGINFAPEPTPWLAIGGQTAYSNSDSRIGGFEVWTIGITFSLQY